MNNIKINGTEYPVVKVTEDFGSGSYRVIEPSPGNQVYITTLTARTWVSDTTQAESDAPAVRGLNNPLMDMWVFPESNWVVVDEPYARLRDQHDVVRLFVYIKEGVTLSQVYKESAKLRYFLA